MLWNTEQQVVRPSRCYSRPASQFPWVLLDIGEGPPRYIRSNISAKDALLGSPNMSKRQLGSRPDGDIPGRHSSLGSIGSSRSHEDDLDSTRSLRKHDEEFVVNREYLEHLRFDGDDSTEALRYIVKTYKVFVFDSRASPNDEHQARYQKTTTRQIYKFE